jgi:acyl-CoA reductase-like NAD-dependent aldehyde dehydrogenase
MRREAQGVRRAGRSAARWFIGSIATGYTVAARAAGKELLLEMGADGPLVILDADLDAAVTATLGACFLNAGQSCTAGSGYWSTPTSTTSTCLAWARRSRRRSGSAIRSTARLRWGRSRTRAWPTRPRRTCATRPAGAPMSSSAGGASQLGSDLFFEATAIDGVTEQMEIAREETFGPVLPVSVIRDERHAIDIVNGSPYGLLSAVFTADLGRGLRYAEAVRTGWVNVNEGMIYWESHLPLGGRAGSRSGIGSVGGRFAMERLTELKTIVVNLG